MNWRLTICVGWILFLTCIWKGGRSYVVSAELPVDPRFSAAAAQEADRRINLLNREIGELEDHPWAGAYYAGDGLGMNQRLLIAPDNGFVYQWHGCLGLYERNYGDIAVEGDRLRPGFTFPNDPEQMGMDAEYLVVRWGERRYLVPPNDVIGFCNYVNAGYEPRASDRGFVLMRTGDASKAVTGQPQVPASYRDYLLEEPVEAKIIGVDEPTLRPGIVTYKDTHAMIDAGADQGLKSGMDMFVDDGRLGAEARLVAVWPDRSQVLLTQFGEDAPTPKVGWRLSTRASWAR